MTIKTERSRRDLIDTALLGIGRGASVRILTHPLDVVRTHQQAKRLGNSFHVAAALYQESGVRSFFSGLSPQLVRTSLKQAWIWPIVAYCPPLIPVNDPIKQQVITGLLIAVADATISTPLERAKIDLIVSGKRSFSIRSLWKEGWNGYLMHLSKLAICWSTFLASQKFFRDQNIEPGKKANVRQLCDIALKTSLLVSIVSAPLDVANTQKFANNLSFSTFIATNSMRTLFRGWPLNFVALLIHNIASVALIDQLDRR